MDPEIWGKLKQYIGLDKVYAKLPPRKFFQLRLVCKDWNRLASDRQFLQNTFNDADIEVTSKMRFLRRRRQALMREQGIPEHIVRTCHCERFMGEHGHEVHCLAFSWMP